MSKFYRLISLVLIFAVLLTVLSGCHHSGITAAEKQSIIDAAVAYQTDGNIYHADSYDVVKLPKGAIIYGMLPGQSVFYTDNATIDKGRGSYKELYTLLQVRPHPTYGYRTRLGKYEVLEDTYVASGLCLANSVIIIDGQTENLGAGGGLQYVVFDFDKKLKLLEETDLHE
jgi:hypothetical protein